MNILLILEALIISTVFVILFALFAHQVKKVCRNFLTENRR